MTTKIAAIPPLDGVKDPAIKRVLQSIKDMLEIRDGQRKSQGWLDRYVTLREFVDAAGGTSSGGGSGSEVNLGSLIGTIGGGYAPTERVDLSRPPTLSGLQATSTMTTIFLSWNSWTRDHRHGLTEVWRANVNDIGQAVLVGTAPGDIYMDPVGDMQQTAYYWIRAISRFPGAPPGAFNQVAGVQATTVADPQKIFDTIIGADPSLPFVHYPTDTEINGQLVPAGTYISSLYVPFGVINKLHFDKATGNKIIADDATFGDVLADTIKVVNANIVGEIKSDNFATGSAGWRIHKNGVAEFSNAIVRGTVYANGGEFYGTLKGGGATSYTSGTGLWAGDYGGSYALRLGSTSNYLRWTGSGLELRGTLSITDASGNIILSSGMGVPWDKISSKPDPTSFLETFESGSVAQWTNYVGSGELSIVSVPDSLTGGKVLRIGNNSGDDQAWLIHKQNIPFDPSALYRIKFRVRRTAGTGAVWLGVAGIAADGVTFVNIVGENSYSSQHYVAASYQTPGSAWTEYVGYVKGTAVTGQSGTNPPVTAPLKLHQSVKYIRPLILVNYDRVAGTTEVDYCSIELMTDTMNWDDVSGTGKDTLITTASTALTNANAAQIAANNANNTLADIASDNKLTPVEKQSAANEWGIINRERASIQAQASALGISSELNDYNYTYAVLNDYITPLLADLQSPSAIDGPTFRDKWSYFYEYRQRLINKMAAVAATKADWASVTGYGKPLDNSGRVIDGDRFTNPNPADFPPGETFYLKQSTSVGVTGAGTYGVLRTVRPYGTGADLSGGGVFQWFEAEQLVWARKSTSATAWSSWQRVPNETITPSNVTTYIDNAAIGNAQIGGDLWSTNWNHAGGTGWLLDRSGNFYGNNIYARGDIEASSLKANTAMVNTLHINGNAVTVPVTYTSTATITLAFNAWTTIGSAYINPEGAVVFVHAFAQFSNNDNIDPAMHLRVVSPSGQVIVAAARPVTSSLNWGTGNYTRAGSVSLSGAFSETGTYTIQLHPGAFSGHFAHHRALLLLAGKR